MSNKKSKWKGRILAFVITFSVLLSGLMVFSLINQGSKDVLNQWENHVEIINEDVAGFQKVIENKAGYENDELLYEELSNRIDLFEAHLKNAQNYIMEENLPNKDSLLQDIDSHFNYLETLRINVEEGVGPNKIIPTLRFELTENGTRQIF